MNPYWSEAGRRYSREWGRQKWDWCIYDHGVGAGVKLKGSKSRGEVVLEGGKLIADLQGTGLCLKARFSFLPIYRLLGKCI